MNNNKQGGVSMTNSFHKTMLRFSCSGLITLERLDALVPGLQSQSTRGDVGFSMCAAVTINGEKL